MSLYENRIYIELRKLYYFFIKKIFKKTGMPIVINGFRLRFHPQYYRWFPSNYERDSFEFIRDCVEQGSVCVDIGAHFGLYSIILAKYFNCRVYSFEPTKASVEVLIANINMNQVEGKIDVVQKAVSSESSQLYFYVQETVGAVSNSLVDYWHSDEKKNKVLVDVVSVDDFFNDIKYDFLKIDAEGVEYDVLLGATKTIKKYNPKIILALHPKAIVARGHSLKLIWEMLKSFEYACYFRKKRMSEDEFCSKKELFDVYCLINN